jgi:ABC-type branched-subunit amino acid transport system ATPase component
VTPDDAILAVEGLAAGYGNAKIIQDVSITVSAGEIVGVLGPNGAGKSTLMKAIVGLATRYAGTVWFQGTDISELEAHERSRMGLGYLPQQDAIFPEFTVEENLQLAGQGNPAAATDLDSVYEQFPQLRDLASRKATLLSGGERKMLALGCVVVTDPDAYLFDEPSDGLAPNLATDTFERIEQLATEGKAILINEQKEQVLEHIDRAYLLRGGGISDEGDAERLLEEGRLRETYFQNDARSDGGDR